MVSPEKECTSVSSSEVDRGIMQCNFSVPITVDDWRKLSSNVISSPHYYSFVH
jgi:hypothetical protein